VRQQYASSPVRFTPEPCVIHWAEGIALLRGAGVTADELGDLDDLSTAQELLLGRLVADKYGEICPVEWHEPLFSCRGTRSSCRFPA
jgi:aspartyl-tRNA synthetase